MGGRVIAEPAVQVGVNSDRTAVVRIVGEITSATLAGLRATLENVAGSGPLIVDLSQVTQLDSTGVDLLTDVAGERGLELVVGPGCPVFSVVQVSGLGEVAPLQCR